MSNESLVLLIIPILAIFACVTFYKLGKSTAKNNLDREREFNVHSLKRWECAKTKLENKIEQAKEPNKALELENHVLKRKNALLQLETTYLVDIIKDILIAERVT